MLRRPAWTRRFTIQRPRTRRGAALVWTAVTSTVILGVAALAVDLGYVRMVQAEMQVAADAAALAGASALINPELSGSDASDLIAEATSRAVDYAGENSAAKKYLYLDPADVTVGYIDNPSDLDSPLITNASTLNAVRVVIRKSPGSENGPVKLFFASIWGKTSTSLAVTATGYLDSRFAAYKPRPNQQTSALLPVTVRTSKWLDEIVSQTGEDNFGYDSETGQITEGPDGIAEVSIYPEHQKKLEEDHDGGGAFGILDFGTHGAAKFVAEQLRNGLTQDQIVSTVGTDTITFVDEDGSPVTLEIESGPGLMASLADDFATHLGQVIGFFTHDDIEGNGQHAVYTLSSMQFGRLMKVKLTGPPKNKVIVIQPASYTGREIITQDGAASHYTASRIKLVR